MADSFSCPITPNFNMFNALNFMRDQLIAQGYEVSANPMGPSAGSLSVRKDDDGIKKLLGMSSSCDVTLTVMANNTLAVNIQSDWTNKIIAMAVGWFLCWIPFITGIIGCINQSDLPKKIRTTIQSACAF